MSRRSGTSLPPNYPLYKLSRFLYSPSSTSQITCVAAAASPTFPNGHAFTAVALSTSDVLVRYLGPARIPVVQHFACNRGTPGSHVSALCFDPSAQWLLVLCEDGTLTLFAVYFLCCRRSNAGPGAGELSRQSSGYGKGAMKALSTDRPHVLPARRSLSGSTACVWWKPTGKVGDYVVVGTAAGHVVLIDLATGEERMTIKLKTKIERLAVAADAQGTFKHLIIKTATGHTRLALEQDGKTILEAAAAGETAQGSVFFPEQLPFSPDTEIDMQTTSFGPVARVFHPTTGQLEIYSPEFGKYPLFVLQMPRGTVGMHYTRPFTFAFTNSMSPIGSSGGQSVSSPITMSGVSLVSNMIAGSAANASTPKSFSRKNPSVMQRFQLEPDEHFGGFFSFPPAAVSSSPSASSSLLSSSSTSPYATLGGIDANGYSTAFASPQSTGSDRALQVCFLWTNKAVYHCRPIVDVVSLFKNVISQGTDGNDSENLGMTLNLDLYSLYEEAADKCFANKDYARALSLYRDSNVNPSKLVQKFVSVGRLDVVVEYVKNLLHQPEALPKQERKLLSDVLFRVFLLRLVSLEESSDDTFLREFEQFINDNRDYNEISALELLLSHGCSFTKQFLLVAHVRGQMPLALKMLAESGRTTLSSESLTFLCENSHAEDIKNQKQLFAMLPPDAQARIILSNPSTVLRHTRKLFILLPVLSSEIVADIVNLFHPSYSTFFVPPTVSSSVPDSSVSPLPPLSSTFGSPSVSPAPRIVNPRKVLSKTTSAVPSFPSPSSSPYQFSLSHPNGFRPSPNELSSDASNGSSGGDDDYEDDDDEEDEYDLIIGKSPKRRHRRGPSNSIRANNDDDLVTQEELVELYLCALMVLLSRKSSPNSPANLSLPSSSSSSTDLSMLPVVPSSFTPRVLVTQVACGSSHILATTSDSWVYSWGSNKYGECGLGSATTDPIPHPQRIESLVSTPVMRVSAGGHHSFCVCKNGSVYSWGLNTDGQLALGPSSPSSVPSPRPVEALRGVWLREIACGGRHTLFCTTGGVLLACGANDRGQLGLGHTEGPQPLPLPVKLRSGQRADSAACGRDHSACCTESGLVCTWGAGDSGQLGHGGEMKDETLPKKVGGLSAARVVSVACGPERTCAVTDLQTVYAWGKGAGDEPRSPGALRYKKAVSAVCGGESCVIVDEVGAVCIWEGESIVRDITWGSKGEKEGARHVAGGVGEDGNESFALVGGDGALYVWGSGKGKTPSRVEIGMRNGGCGERTEETENAEDLEKTLQDGMAQNWGGFRLHVVARAAAAMGLWDTVALGHKLAGDSKHAFAAKLASVAKKEGSSPQEDAERIIELAEGEMESLMTPVKVTSLKDDSGTDSSNKAGESLLLFLLLYWENHGLPTEPLTQFIQRHLEELSLAFSSLLLSPDSSNNSAPTAALKVLSPEQRFHVAQKALVQMQKQASGISAGEAPLETLWSEISTNIPLDTGKRDTLTLPISDALTKTAVENPSSNPQSLVIDVVAFTCSHRFFTRRELVSSLLPSFNSTLESLQVPLPLTAKLAANEYKQTFISFACPKCLGLTMSKL